MHLKIGTRGSALALAQAEIVGQTLKQKISHLTYELVVIQTKGDRVLDKALHQMMDKGLFVKEIEQQLMDGTIDLAVHSYKDVPSQLLKQFVIAPVLVREDAQDVLISRDRLDFFSLPPGSIVGTGSFRRIQQLSALRPDLVFENVRGNIVTRLKKLDDGQYDALVLAQAGLKRLGLEERICQVFTDDQCIPACAQGALAIELCRKNTELLEVLERFANRELDECINHERAFLKEMGGSCAIPVGAHMVKEEEGYTFYTVYGDDRSIVKTKNSGSDMDCLLELALSQTKEAFHE